MSREEIINTAKKLGRLSPLGLVLCENCDTPASLSLSQEIGWIGCSPCITGEADSFDDEDLVALPVQELKLLGIEY